MHHLSMLILGAVQGAAEFLPISSSGHLALAKMLMKNDTEIAALSEMPMLLDILLHLATLLAVLIFFRKQIAEAVLGGARLLKSLFSGTAGKRLREDDGAMVALCVLIATVPTAILGFALKDAAETFGASAQMLGLTFLVCGGVLVLTRFKPGSDKRLTMWTAVLIGLAQGIAVLPGLSRSGTTIAVALMLGLSRKEAFSFSFLLSIPAILGAAVLEIDPEQLATGDHLAAFSVAVIAAFAVGFGALFFLSKTVDKGRLWWFAPYMGAVGIFALISGI